MKKILLFCLVFSLLNTFAQHPDLQTNNWFVESVTINGVTTDIPADPVTFPYAFFNFFEVTNGYIGTSNNPFWEETCSIGFTGHVNYIGTNQFDFIDYTFFNDSTDCSTDLINFMNLYVSFFNDTIDGIFNYTISDEDDGSKTLVITNDNADTVTFTDRFFTPAPPELTDKIWYIHQLVIDNNNIPIPNNAELSPEDLSVNFDYILDSYFYTFICDAFYGYHFFDETQSRYYLYEMGQGLVDCNFNENTSFFLNFIFFHTEYSPGPFNYVYTTDGSNETLTVTNSNGDIVVYGNTALSIPDNILDTTILYPNPVKDKLFISVDKSITITGLTIFDIQGKKVLQVNSPFKSVNVSHLSQGLFFVKISTDMGEIIKKIVKD